METKRRGESNSTIRSRRDLMLGGGLSEAGRVQ